MKKEYVMVFRRDLLDDIGSFSGITCDMTYISKLRSEILDNKNYSFMDRAKAEDDIRYKQVIPYCLIKFRDSIFSYCRGKLLSEKRLLKKYSIGVGGHVSSEDPSLFDNAYDFGLKREIQEEVDIESGYTNNFVALINDDSNDVGKVHIGFVHILELNDEKIQARQQSINDAKLLSIEYISSRIERYENWSKLCIEKLPDLIKS